MELNRAIEILDAMIEHDDDSFGGIVYLKRRELILEHIEGLSNEELKKVLELIVELKNK